MLPTVCFGRFKEQLGMWFHYVEEMLFFPLQGHVYISDTHFNQSEQTGLFGKAGLKP